MLLVPGQRRTDSRLGVLLILQRPKSSEIDRHIPGELGRQAEDFAGAGPHGLLALLLELGVGQRLVLRCQDHRAGADHADLVQVAEFHVPNACLAGLEIDLAVFGLGYRAAEILAATARRAAGQVGADFGAGGPLPEHGVALEDAGQEITLLGQQIPLAEIRVDRPNRA